MITMFGLFTKEWVESEGCYKTKQQIEESRSNYICNIIHNQEKEIKSLKAEIVELNKTIAKLNDILKSTDSEYGKYLRLKERYMEL